MSCLSRLVGLICVIVPGLLFLAFSARFFFLWPRLGFVVGPLYSLVSLITGIVCLYLGLSLLLGQKEREENASALGSSATEAMPELPRIASSSNSASSASAELPIAELVAAPLPEPLAARTGDSYDDAYIEAAPQTLESAPAATSIFSKQSESDARLDTPETRIRRLAATRPAWQVTAPQLAQLANLGLSVTDATARAMARNGDAQIQSGPNGETVYFFDLAD